MNAQDLQNLINQFKQSATVKALDEYFQEKSMMEICGVDRDENTHSNFLAWLFENEITGKEACCLLNELINNKANKQGNSITCTDIKKVQVTREDFVRGEYAPDSNGKIVQSVGKTIVKGRADIVIDIETNANPRRIIIENKIDSEEKCEWKVNIKTGKKDKNGNDIEVLDKDKSLWQTQFYFDYYKNYKNDATYVFLTLSGKNGSRCDEFIHLTYQDLMDGILVPLLGKLESESPLSPEYTVTIQKIKEYMKALGIRYSQDGIMAADPYLASLAKQLWDENRDLFLLFKIVNNNEKKELINLWNEKLSGEIAYKDIIRLVFEALYASYPNDNDIKGVYQSINIKDGNGKDPTKYNVYVIVNGQEQSLYKAIGKNELFRNLVITYIISKKNNVDLLDLQQVFPASLHGKTSSAQNSRNNDNNIVTNYKKNDDYKDLHINSNSSNKFYVCQTGWDGTAMMSRLIRYVKTIPELNNLKILEIPAFLK